MLSPPCETRFRIRERRGKGENGFTRGHFSLYLRKEVKQQVFKEGCAYKSQEGDCNFCKSLIGRFILS